jgi:carotenoid cleavage dioxygenase-like enzyme
MQIGNEIAQFAAGTRPYSSAALDLPITFDFARAMNGESMLAWKPENGSRIGAVPRSTDSNDCAAHRLATFLSLHRRRHLVEGDLGGHDGTHRARAQ